MLYPAVLTVQSHVDCTALPPSVCGVEVQRVSLWTVTKILNTALKDVHLLADIYKLLGSILQSASAVPKLVWTDLSSVVLCESTISAISYVVCILLVSILRVSTTFDVVIKQLADGWTSYQQMTM